MSRSAAEFSVRTEDTSPSTTVISWRNAWLQMMGAGIARSKERIGATSAGVAQSKPVPL
jgi:hypothetical protein